MISKVRYQVFVSSTYEDLREERQETTQSILEAECFPSGMELFPASNDNQWELIKRVIQESDYYVVIVGGRYGSCGPSGLSYTEMEYDYAVSIDVPILGFVRKDPENIPNKHTESSAEGKERLKAFREKVLSRTCRYFSEPKDLGMAVLKSLMQEARIRPQLGWVRADQLKSQEELEEELELKRQLKEAKEKIKKLDRALRDQKSLDKDFETSKLARGEDKFDFEIIYNSKDKKAVAERVQLTWNEILKSIGPQMYGYVQRQSSIHDGYPFEPALEHTIRSKIIDKIGTRTMTLNPNSVNTCIFHLKELGFVAYEIIEEEGQEPFRGITLTRRGEVELSSLLVSTKGPQS